MSHPGNDRYNEFWNELIEEPKMTHAAFDTLAYANRFKSVGCEPKLAEVQANAMAEIYNTLLDDKLVTRDHLDIKVSYLESKINQLEIKIIKWMVGLMFAQTALVLAVVKMMLNS